MIKQLLVQELSNIIGWKTKRKLVVIDSDDWGSIRIPSKEVLLKLEKDGLKLDSLVYNRFDSLASREDLIALFDTLSRINDSCGNSPVLTANTIVANPDFERIRASCFTEYFNEPFTKTLERYPGHRDSFRLWKEGINARLFKPQFHGMQHVNVFRWMNALRQGEEDIVKAFELGMFDLSTETRITRNSFMDALNMQTLEEIPKIRESIASGLKLFNDLLGYKSLTFVAPSYIWHRGIETALLENGVQIIKGAYYQLEPLPGEAHNFKKIYHYTGQRTRSGLIYLTRNASFEPSASPDYDWTGEILKRAHSAFYWGKPLVISSHRMNFIGYIDKTNRDRNLPLLQNLLKSLLKEWPDIEFIGADELGEIIFTDHRN
jgi:hypothetical protein